MKIEVDLSQWPSIDKVMETHDVVAFRAPKKDDYYIDVYGTVDISRYDYEARTTGFRPIVVRKQPTAEQIREAVNEAVAKFDMKVLSHADFRKAASMFGISLTDR